MGAYHDGFTVHITCRKAHIYFIRKKCVIEITKSLEKLFFIFSAIPRDEPIIYPFPQFFLREEGLMKKVINN